MISHCDFDNTKNKITFEKVLPNCYNNFFSDQDHGYDDEEQHII